MNYEVAYHLHCRIDLDSGIRIRLYELNQVQTYEGLLAGVPSSFLNDRQIEGAMEMARTRFRSEPTLIEPPRRNFLREPGDMDSPKRRHSPEWLPMICCIGRFKST